MKKFKIPVTWEVYGTIEIEADSLEEAIQKFDDIEINGEGHDLPLKNCCCAKFLIKQRKEIFVKKVSEILSGILYEKSRVYYDIHSDNFTMFIYFGKRNTNCLDAFLQENQIITLVQ